ncbi:MAG: AbrB/MazE/SpoVT family DNA-binding domain-containing protein [Betaproteobacteria bacterium]|nr:AbrB/MazE/SpoVT family DNA-binding domain-containing protein [Betaproteobacteria bacterium]MDE2123337.1 AbrB/MazE/SpoVT family DNA-binding domain-containing protein [Betaproteobacteria bacterium]MDE2187913.1 AbrB/MazE/SpoVT family DNA-binding domain-containing protein [Betaproteobacteria bacterium]MDE2326084.1 AbrB/MazE/SpoVT family DNA-binding domain-containing protein [Betaproteobacteria bacterium]
MSFMTGVYVTAAVAILCTLGSVLFVMRLAQQENQSRNQHRGIGIPPEILKALGVEAGDTLAWEVGEDGTVRVRRAERAVKSVECP